MSGCAALLKLEELNWQGHCIVTTIEVEEVGGVLGRARVGTVRYSM